MNMKTILSVLGMTFLLTAIFVLLLTPERELIEGREKILEKTKKILSCSETECVFS